MASNPGRTDPVPENPFLNVIPRLLLDRREREHSPRGSHATVSIGTGPVGAPALVLATANARSSYEGPVANAGIVLSLNGNDRLAQADSFEGSSSSMTFHAQASLMLVLREGESGEVQAGVIGMGVGYEANRDTSVELHVVAIAL